MWVENRLRGRFRLGKRLHKAACLKPLNFSTYSEGQSLSLLFPSFPPTLLTGNLTKGTLKIKGSCSSFSPICAPFYSRAALESRRKAVGLSWL